MKSPNICVTCKGTKKLCGLSSCPLLNKIEVSKDLKNKIKQDVFGPSSDLFVGSQGYPHLSVGPMVSAQGMPMNGSELYGKSYEEIVENRAILLRGKRYFSVGTRIEERMEEVAMSTTPVDVEMRFSKIPYFNMQFSSLVEPMGASGTIKQYNLADNPKIPKKVDTIVGEGLRAVQAVEELSNYGMDNYYLINLMSAGLLGKKDSKRIVPTRWSITAVDDTIGKNLLEKVRDYPGLNEIRLYSNRFLHNHFEVLLLPGSWEFENFESWSPKSMWAQGSKETITTEEYESFWGRTKYADKQAGGYYASRVGVIEYLHKIRRQARALVFREIGEGYIIPVGVWEVRENVRNAMNKLPMKFSTLDEAMQELNQRLSVPLDNYKKLSRVLTQRRLIDF